MRKLFFNNLMKSYMKTVCLQTNGLHHSSSFENFDDWFPLYQKDNPEISDLSDEEIPAHWMIWSKKFMEELFLNELFSFGETGIILYRAILVNSIESIHFNNLGECWSIYPHTDVIFHEYAENDAQLKVIMKAEIPLDAIDYEATVEFLTNPWAFQKEGEIRLIKGKKAKLLELNEKEFLLESII